LDTSEEGGGEDSVVKSLPVISISIDDSGEADSPDNSSSRQQLHQGIQHTHGVSTKTEETSSAVEDDDGFEDIATGSDFLNNPELVDELRVAHAAMGDKYLKSDLMSLSVDKTPDTGYSCDASILGPECKMS
jgi:hypothetical protein